MLSPTLFQHINGPPLNFQQEKIEGAWQNISCHAPEPLYYEKKPEVCAALS